MYGYKTKSEVLDSLTDMFNVSGGRVQYDVSHSGNALNIATNIPGAYHIKIDPTGIYADNYIYLTAGGLIRTMDRNAQHAGLL